jgi:cytoskeletal protein RodZ
MARRRQKNGNNKWLILIQIVIMAGVLVFIIFFRDTIGSGASSAFDTVAGTEDIEVEGADEVSEESTVGDTSTKHEGPSDDPEASKADEDAGTSED